MPNLDEIIKKIDSVLQSGNPSIKGYEQYIGVSPKEGFEKYKKICEEDKYPAPFSESDEWGIERIKTRDKMMLALFTYAYENGPEKIPINLSNFNKIHSDSIGSQIEAMEQIISVLSCQE